MGRKRSEPSVRLIYRWSRVNIPEVMYEEIVEYVESHPNQFNSPTDFVNQCVALLVEKEKLKVRAIG